MCDGNKLIIAAAGSGKTTHLVNSALKEKGNVLITTFTEANEAEIKKKILERTKCIPRNITVQTWFSFLLQHGVRPYQGVMNEELFEKKIGFYLIEGKSGLRGHNRNGQPIYWGELDFFKFYFTKDLKIYSDKISRFAWVCNDKSGNETINRITRIYKHIYVDEVQDLAGWDLEIIKLLLQTTSKIIMVGDPRQSTYSTNDSPKHLKYRGKIHDFIKEKCPAGVCEIDSESLKVSHRNCGVICDFSSKLYLEHPKCEPCECDSCRKESEHQGIYLIKPGDIESYCAKFKGVTCLHYREAVAPALNFGVSKGLGFDRVIIYPTDKILKYIKSGNITDIETVKAKFYVALTRARYSVGIVCDYDTEDYIEGITKY